MKKTNETKMKNGITELVFILDRSGSMAGLESDTIGGFNSLIEKQKQQEGECFVTTVLFDHEILTLHDRVKLADVKPLTNREYEVRGCTALVDAIGETVTHISDIHRYAREEDVPENTLFVIITDGMENASKNYSSQQVKQLISQKKELGWEFLFIGANIDSVETAGFYGISPDRAVNYHADKKGTRVVYDAVAGAVGKMRSCAPLEADWSEEISADFKSR